MPENSSPTRSYRKCSKALFFIFLVTLIVIVSILSNNLFSVKTIAIDSNDKTELLGLNGIMQTNIFFINETDVEKNIINLNPSIKSVAVSKILPNTIKISYNKYKPELYIAGNTKFLLLSNDGRILKKINSRPVDLAEIHYYQKLNEQALNVGDRLTYKDILMSFYFFNSLSNLGFKVDSIDISGFDMIVCKVSSKEIVFSSNINKEKAMYAVGEIMKRFRVEGKDYKKIDVRFDKPIVSF